VIQLVVADVDEAYKRVVDAGGQPTIPPFDSFSGDRYGCVTDPYRHVWALATTIEVLTSDEIESRLARALRR
jgi:PhnB protein